jgi:hypothetical protein
MGGCQSGPDKGDIFSHIVEILSVGYLDVDIGTPFYHWAGHDAVALWRLPVHGERLFDDLFSLRKFVAQQSASRASF